MNFATLPSEIEGLTDRTWSFFEPFYTDLQERPLNTTDFRQWLGDWSQLTRVIFELFSTLSIEKTQDTSDQAREDAYNDFVTNIYPNVSVADQGLKERLLAVDPQDEDLRLLMRDMRNEAELFREENVPLNTELQLLETKYDKLTGGLKVEWGGKQKNLSQMQAHLESKDRAVREEVWRLYMAQWQTVRTPLNDLYLEMLTLRKKISRNAGFDDYRAYAFREHGRFDYSPEDCLTFHQAIEEAVVPALQRILQKMRTGFGVPVLKPWDWMPEIGLLAEINSAAPLQPYQSEDELIQGGVNIFNQVDVELGRHFAEMAESGLLDLESRQGKAMGGYCSSLPLRGKPFIFMNGNGTHDTVQTLLHEAGHAFHAFEGRQPLVWSENPPMEFCEVASMAMELLAAPYLDQASGGFYNEMETARARVEHLSKTLLFFPYMAVVDAFQHWVYTTPDEVTPAALDAKWDELEERFLCGIDWTGLEEMRMSGWHRKLHIFQIPFYYVEYGMASVGALQVWRRSLQEGQAVALAAYRQALAFGGTLTLPDLFTAAGAEFRFDTALLTELVNLVETTIDDLQQQFTPLLS